jgi:hypothetical protein
MKIDIKVAFTGVVRVVVPDDAYNPYTLAEKLALCKVVASVENPDSPDDQACNEYAKEAGGLLIKAEEAWDASYVDGLSGVWVSLDVLLAPRKKEPKTVSMRLAIWDVVIAEGSKLIRVGCQEVGVDVIESILKEFDELTTKASVEQKYRYYTCRSAEERRAVVLALRELGYKWNAAQWTLEEMDVHSPFRLASGDLRVTSEGKIVIGKHGDKVSLEELLIPKTTTVIAAVRERRVAEELVVMTANAEGKKMRVGALDIDVDVVRKIVSTWKELNTKQEA